MKKKKIFKTDISSSFPGSAGMSVVKARCTICTSQFHTNNIAALPCGHTFHYPCISQWFQNSKTCPNCRVKTQERNVIKQLYFEPSEEESSSQREGVDYAAKSEELSIELERLKNESSQVQEDVLKWKKLHDVVADKLEKEKQKLAKKLPSLEAQNRQLSMMIDDQTEVKEKYEQAKARLRVCEFYKLLLKGEAEQAEEAIDKYVGKAGDPESAQFLVLMKRQLNEAKKKQIQLSEDIRNGDRRFREQLVKEQELKKIIQALKEEMDELRAAAQKSKSSPYNRKLKPMFDLSPQKRISMGFNETINLNEDVMKSALRPTRSKPAVSFSSKPSTSSSFIPTLSLASSKGGGATVSRSRIFDDPLADDLFDSDEMEQLISKKVSSSSKLLDDTCKSPLIPDNVMRSALAGSPKRKQMTFEMQMRAARMKSLENLEMGFAAGSSAPSLKPRPVKSIPIKRKASEKNLKTETTAGKRISQFFTRNTADKKKDEVIDLE